MSTSNQQTLADSGANERPPMLERGNYIPWESRFRRFLDNKLEDGERMWNSIKKGPYKRPMIPNSDNDQEEILEPLSKMTEGTDSAKITRKRTKPDKHGHGNEKSAKEPEDCYQWSTKSTLGQHCQNRSGNKKQYITDVKVMNYLLQAIPNDIYNSVDAYKNAKDIWERIKRLMFGSDVTNHVRHSRFMDEFDKFAAKEGESLESVYERLTTLVNIMDRNNVRPIPVSINTKFLNCFVGKYKSKGQSTPKQKVKVLLS
ncbi:hypothetical protein Tco_0004844 [Tanacetum coccineum]